MNLVGRASKLSDNKFWFSNLSYIHDILILNNYPRWFFILERKKEIEKRKSYFEKLGSINNTPKPNDSYSNIFTLPYTHSFTFKHKHFFKNNIRLVFNNERAIYKILFSYKPNYKREFLNNSNIINKISCKVHEMTSLVNTSEYLKDRIYKHIQNVKIKTKTMVKPNYPDIAII